MSYDTKTVLVTGANSGVGFATAKLLAMKGFKKVILSARSQKKADDAVQELINSHKCKNVFDTLILDTSDVSSVRAAVATLLKKEKLDWLILNAGATVKPNPNDAIEVQFRVHILGHHLLVEGLLAQKHINPGGRVILASSEVSLKKSMAGKPSLLVPSKIASSTKHNFNGDLVKALEYIMTADTHGDEAFNRYATVKMLSNFWAFKMAQLDTDGITYNAVSPGSVMESSYVSSGDMPFLLKTLRQIMKTKFGRWMGMSQTAADGARNYIDTADSGVNGKYYGSPMGKYVGKATDNTAHVINDPAVVDAFWTALGNVVSTV